MKKITLLSTSLLLLSACNGTNEDEPTENLSSEPIEVEVLNDSEATVDEEWTLKAEVTQEEEPVEDADEVVFEVWYDEEKQNSAMISAEHGQDGVYEADYQFPEASKYYVQPHVTARGMHRMPVHEVEVSEAEQ
ncbi:hypothetical protein HNR44_002703 [Geomicrobium halophilum]|uniref:YtkA-like domain-containing protein n=1 Tax=Geomicrobium halophilum TaxID=549000 RepID=A0A841PZY1_9BACL|nr:FixH family protein [Geomicrobium halophilum]MBB6450713.1 hypothetical protein [Geomicrobium halophilum]